MFFLRSFNLLVLALLLIAILPILASPTPAHDLTNAERFRRGLPPNAPRRRFEASLADSARKARRSG
ncbi:hypothetical protein CALVIDRAFT_567673 [Calocera viscosa TUFC12733]|uniref:Uncharacterized protein n=1 Tax=Calocera viscosa (strain TUFC12733) TaxID=1330018 RepID=A0A167HXV7_CALVF|nr:hypothetical protein CALVIDRAFT_567673 [Calocera viscosa TUFC12733]